MPHARHVELRRTQCLTWTVASRTRLDAAQAGGPLPRPGRVDAERGVRDALRRRGDLYLGIVALDQALTAARWAGGAPGERSRRERIAAEVPGRPAPGEPDLPMPLGVLEAARQRVRAVRNLVVHLDDRLAVSLPATLIIDAAGLRASQGRSESGIEFAEWRAWLDALEAWASRSAEAAPDRTGGEPDRAP